MSPHPRGSPQPSTIAGPPGGLPPLPPRMCPHPSGSPQLSATAGPPG
eukprot:CAMPEP_0118975716 /NCGR_PEP_ID=MMETSP1173-20130426/16602_1 /TAXON_ID=1034831 /ORGANISM="Rhizochromulina marina cf, Strain CCMP1243" /LENGTH=46 /DNA_ID= /DNA_START= /DNA_END= /DNA_ORIENTATION=